ncbi:MAG: SGNH/GDSL hydrolase family protein [Anaerolineales bacterium]
MKRTVFWIISSLILLLFFAGCTGNPAKPAEPYRVLFIGDSTTSRNDIPGKFAKLAELGGHEVIVASSTKDYTSLATHTRLPQTTSKLEVDWDIVVLQENEAILLDPESRRDFSVPVIEQYIETVNNMGGVTLLYSSIGFREGLSDFQLDDYEATQDAIDAAYVEIGNELNLPIAPVGEIWRRIYEADPDFDLWQLDGLHVSPEGAYLAACVFYTVIYNQTPLDLPVSGEFVIDPAAIELIHQTVADVLSGNQDQYSLPLFGP